VSDVSSLAWQKRRAAFNHDLLKNRYLIALSKWLNLLNGEIEDARFEKLFISSLLPMWEDARKEVFNIAIDFEKQMSPAILFDAQPLSNCTAFTKTWLPFVVHELWLERCDVRSKVEDLLQKIDAADASYKLIQSLLQSLMPDTSAQTLQVHYQAFNNFREDCTELAKCLEHFPDEVNIA